MQDDFAALCLHAQRTFLEADSLRYSLQAVMVPIVLENLHCTGTEASLLGCPGTMEERNYEYGYTYALIHSTAFRVVSCDPFRSAAGAYAFMACGMIDGPGGNATLMRETIPAWCTPSSMLVTGVLESMHTVCRNGRGTSYVDDGLFGGQWERVKNGQWSTQRQGAALTWVLSKCHFIHTTRPCADPVVHHAHG